MSAEQVKAKHIGRLLVAISFLSMLIGAAGTGLFDQH